ncbi:MAG: NAD-dependent epimerase/dehydratase family protein, partial [Flavobacteriaceae bacterium]|nr:NAD-dependent epimerase/dehydratase family protein [Flavobacteriaceae bacterium]
MKIFITGATGYIGNRLTYVLANNNNDVHILVRDLKSKNIPVSKNIKVFQGDLCDFNSIYQAMKGCEYVYHAAAFTD